MNEAILVSQWVNLESRSLGSSEVQTSSSFRVEEEWSPRGLPAQVNNRTELMVGLSTVLKPTREVEVREDDVGQEAMHVEGDPATLHAVGDDGLHRAEGQHARLMDLPPAKGTPQPGHTHPRSKRQTLEGSQFRKGRFSTA